MGKKQGGKPHLKKSIRETLLQSHSFELPVLHHMTTDVLVMVFQSSYSMALALKRPHHMYEEGQLKGPLKGINFPWSHYQMWIETETQLSVHEVELIQHVQQYLNPSVQESSCSSAIEMSQYINIPNESSPNESFIINQISHPFQSMSLQPRYVIACLSQDTSTMLHEWAHAMYYLNEEYRQLCDTIYNQFHPTLVLTPACRVAIEKELQLRQYAPHVFCDEFQAYMVESASDFGKKWIKELYPIHMALKKALPRMPLIKVFIHSYI